MRQSKICAASVVLSFFLAALTAQAQTTNVERNEFGSDYSGRIALIKDARNKADAQTKYEYLLFPRAGEFKVPVSGRPLWFVINHTIRKDVGELDDTPEEAFDPSYIGIQIISFYRIGVRPSAKVYLFRNANWTRTQDSTFNGRRSMGRSFSHRSIAEFLSYHDEGNSGCVRTDETISKKCALEFDTKFGKWHGSVDSDSEDSWEYGSNWALEPSVVGNNISLKNYLLRFTPNLYVPARIIRPSTSKPVIFSTEVSSLAKVRIRTFAPTFDYSPDLLDNDITLVFE